MGCFFACFGSSKDPKRLKNHHESHQAHHPSTIQRNAIPKPTSIINQTSVHTLPDESKLLELVEAGNRHDESEVTSMKPHEDEHVVLPQEHATSIHSKKQSLKEEEESVGKSSKPESSSENFVVPLNPNFRSSCPPPSHPYVNCKDSDDEDEVFGSHLASDEKDEFGMVESMKKNSMNVSTNVSHGTAYVCPVLNPVENLSHLNAVKSKKEFTPTREKENVELEQESSVEEFLFSSKPSREICVDATSLSNWLASSEATPFCKITATMTLEATITPVKSDTLQGSILLRRSGHRETSEVGTVSKCCRQGVCDKDPDSTSSFKGIPNTTSKYREDKTVKWHSTPFETRLERALNSRGSVA